MRNAAVAGVRVPLLAPRIPRGYEHRRRFLQPKSCLDGGQSGSAAVEEQGSAIVNGTVTTARPEVGFLVNSIYGHRCTATLISQTTIATAAHCISPDSDPGHNLSTTFSVPPGFQLEGSVANSQTTPPQIYFRIDTQGRQQERPLVRGVWATASTAAARASVPAPHSRRALTARSMGSNQRQPRAAGDYTLSRRRFPGPRRVQKMDAAIRSPAQPHKGPESASRA
jgi:hypothetical protein